MLSLIKRIKNNEYSIQGFNAVPIFINAAGRSGISMRENLGYGFSEYIYYYKNNYCEMSYNIADLEMIGQRVKKELKIDSDYLLRVKANYNNQWSRHDKLFSWLNDYDVALSSADELILLFRQCFAAMEDAVGDAHVIEGASWGFDEEINKLMIKELSDITAVNAHLSVLLYPSVPSFVKDEEMALRRINLLPINAREKALTRHFKKYFWVLNSYAGPSGATMNDFRKRLISKNVAIVKDQPIDKEKLMKKLGLSGRLRQMITLADFLTVWQDERKARTLRAISYLDLALEEISRRLEFDKKELYYFSCRDIDSIGGLQDFFRLKKELAERRKGCLFWQFFGGEKVFAGKDYRGYEKYRESIALVQKSSAAANDSLSGIAASVGRVSGRVVIINGLKALVRVKKGDIIVTSMTRPEFMPALRLAAGVITDEGGITCHAAIVCRELNIPCIINTKIATQILKDGDEVEVDADNRVVRKIRG